MRADVPQSFEALVALVRDRRHIQLLTWLEREVHPVAFEPGRVTLATANSTLVGELSRALQEWTGARWMIIPVQPAEDHAPTLHERKLAEQARLITEARGDPRVEAVLWRFPGAEVVKVEVIETEEDAAMPDDEPGRLSNPAVKD